MTRGYQPLLICLIAGSLAAQPGWAQVELKPRDFYVDMVSFAGDSAGISLLEVYYQIYSSKLLYQRQRDQFVARYRVSAMVQKEGKQLTAAETEGFLREESYQNTIRPNDFVVGAFRFPLSPGKYRLVVTLRDLNADRIVPAESDVVVPDYSTGDTHLTPPLFARSVQLATSADSLSSGSQWCLTKRSWHVVPLPSHIYGDGAGRLVFYVEVYRGGQQSDSLRLEYEVRAPRGAVVSSGEKWFSVHDTGFATAVELAHLRPGPYDLVVQLRDRAGHRLGMTEGRFRLSWSALALVENDFEAAVEQLRYIAKSEEVKKLRKTKKEKQVAAWNEFWKSKDPTPGTDENEIRDEYYRRIAYANEHFSLPHREGWKTDLGMIYIMYGEPDEIERHPFDMGGKPYEIWYYYNPKRTFIFVDVNGYGEYVLQYPYDSDIFRRR